jgi:hypothetical protein
MVLSAVMLWLQLHTDARSMYFPCYHHFLQVPRAWAAVAYPCSKPLGGWITELQKRVTFLQQLLDGACPTSFWLPGLWQALTGNVS